MSIVDPVTVSVCADPSWSSMIEVDFGATGSVSHNMISGVSDGAGGAIGILGFNSGNGLVVDGNAIAGLVGNVNSLGIAFEGASGPVVQGNTITDQGLALGFFEPFNTAINQSGNTFQRRWPCRSRLQQRVARVDRGPVPQWQHRDRRWRHHQ